VIDSATFTIPEAGEEELSDLLLDVLPPDGSTLGKLSAREALDRAVERPISEEEYEAVKD
jgi:type I restriction enzyme M protein